jgi:hypothetical protein
MSEQLKTDFDAVAKQVLMHRENEVIPHGHFMHMLNIEIPRFDEYDNLDEYISARELMQFNYMSGMQKLIDHMLTNYKIFLKNERGSGYFICSPTEQVKHGIEHTESVVKRKLRKGTKIVINVDYENVDIVIKQKASDKQAAWSMIKSLIK